MQRGSGRYDPSRNGWGLTLDAIGLTSAIAACAAAAFSGGTLIFTRFQDDKKWRREVLEGALVDFMSGSFSGVGDRARAEMIKDIGHWNYVGYRAKAEAAHSRQTDALTKLRIVGSPGLVRAAVDLHQADWDVQRALLDAETTPPADDEWRTLRLRQTEARDEVMNQARKSIGLAKGPSTARQ